MNKNLEIKCALEMLISKSKVNELITIDLMDSYGYILGEDIFPPLSIPLFDRSPLDGFAVRATDIAVAMVENKFMFGLSGDPAAAFITFQLFVKSVVLKYLGYSNLLPLEVETTLLNDFTKVSKQNGFVRGKTTYKDNQFFTELPQKHSSGVISSLAGVNSLLFIPSGEGPYQKGQKVKIQFLYGEGFTGDTCDFNCSK